MLSLVSTEDPPSSRTARPRNPAYTLEPGIYSEPAIGDNTLFTFLGQLGRPIGYVMIPGVVSAGIVPPEVAALYTLCNAATGRRTG